MTAFLLNRHRRRESGDWSVGAPSAIDHVLWMEISHTGSSCVQYLIARSSLGEGRRGPQFNTTLCRSTTCFSSFRYQPDSSAISGTLTNPFSSNYSECRVIGYLHEHIWTKSRLLCLKFTWKVIKSSVSQLIDHQLCHSVEHWGTHNFNNTSS